MSSNEVVRCGFEMTGSEVRSKNIDQQCGFIVDLVMKTALLRQSYDNVTCIMICFEHYNYTLNNGNVEETLSEIRGQLAKFKESDVVLMKDQVMENTSLMTKLETEPNEKKRVFSVRTKGSRSIEKKALPNLESKHSERLTSAKGERKSKFNF